MYDSQHSMGIVCINTMAMNSTWILDAESLITCDSNCFCYMIGGETVVEATDNAVSQLHLSYLDMIRGWR